MAFKDSTKGDLRGGLDGLVGFDEITEVTFTEPTCKKRMLPMQENPLTAE